MVVSVRPHRTAESGGPQGMGHGPRPDGRRERGRPRTRPARRAQVLFAVLVLGVGGPLVGFVPMSAATGAPTAEQPGIDAATGDGAAADADDHDDHDHDDHDHDHGDHVHAAELDPLDLLERRLLARATAGADLGTATPVTAAAGTGPACSGTGADGRRIEAVYAHVSATPSQAVLDQIAGAVVRVDATFRDSAARSGGDRTVRWVTTAGPSCSLVVRTVPISAAATATGTLFDDLVAAGLSDPTRKYLVWTDGEISSPRTSTCGVGEYWSDDRPGPENLNANSDGTSGPTFAAVDPRCRDVAQGRSVPAHELMHMLGAVQDSAPHATGDGHCTDDRDALCEGPSTVVVPGCASPEDEALFDCNDDDYFTTDPVAGSYLCERWNTARSPYLYGSSTPAPPRAVQITGVSAAPGRVTVTWAGSPSCVPPDGHLVSLSNGAGTIVSGTARSATLDAPVGPTVVTVTPVRAGVAGAGTSVSASVPANRAPVGEIVSQGTSGRDLGIFGYAIDPDTDEPIQVVVVVDGVGWFPIRSDLAWADVPRRRPGYSERHGFLFGRTLPPGARDVCVVAADASGGPSTNLGCFRVSVK